MSGSEKKDLESLNKYLAVVAAAGLAGLVVSLVLLSEFSDQVFRFVELTMTSIFG